MNANPRSRAQPAASSDATRSNRRPRLGKVLDFMRVIWSLDHALQTNSKRMEASLGVTGLQRLAIRIVGRSPGVSAGEIADTLRIHPSTLTGVLKRLEARALLQRVSSEVDARRALFFLTEEGEATNAVHAGTTEAAVRRVIQRHSPEELRAAVMVLSTLVRELESGGK